MATTTNGTYMFCDADLNFSITYTCSGPGCNSTKSHEGLTCTQTGSEFWTCTNGVKCATAFGFTSTFSIAETNTTVLETQQVSMNGTSISFQQDGAGNATLSNPTATTASGGSSTSVATASSTSSTAASPSASNSGSGSSRQSYSSLVLVAMLCFSLFISQALATVTGASIGASVNTIFQDLVHVGDGKSPFDIGAAAIAREFYSITNKTCSTSVGQSASNLSLVYSECEEALTGAEVSLIGSSLGLTLQNTTGLGSVQVTSLTGADEATVVGLDAGAIPALFIANSALCGLLVAVLQQAALNPPGNLCSALGSAVQSHESTSTSSTTLSTSSSTAIATATAISTATSTATSCSGMTTTVAQPSSTASGVLPAGITSNKCLSCFLNTYLYSLVVTSTELCNHAPVVYASAFELSGIFCDPSITTSYSQFCSSLCAKPCAAFSVAGIIKAMGSDYITDPANDVDALDKQCNTCSALDIRPEDYQCKTKPTCLCGLGTQLCAVGCSK